MKTIIAALAAVATVTAVAAPAVAQPYRDNHRHEQGRYEQSRWNGGWVSERVKTADRRIDAGVRRGGLTRIEAQRLRSNLNDFARAESQARRGGVSAREHAALERRWERLIASIRYETRDEQYGYGYGRR